LWTLDPGDIREWQAAEGLSLYPEYTLFAHRDAQAGPPPSTGAAVYPSHNRTHPLSHHPEHQWFTQQHAGDSLSSGNWVTRLSIITGQGAYGVTLPSASSRTRRRCFSGAVAVTPPESRAHKGEWVVLVMPAILRAGAGRSRPARRSAGGIGEHLPGNPHGGAGRGPAGVKGEVRDQLDQLVPGDAVLERASCGTASRSCGIARRASRP
jgi:hypothetical protein